MGIENELSKTQQIPTEQKAEKVLEQKPLAVSEPLDPERQEALDDLKKEFIRSSRAMRVGETTESFNKEREEAWQGEEQRWREKWRQGDADLNTSKQEQRDQTRIHELQQQLGVPENEQSQKELAKVEIQKIFNDEWKKRRNSLGDDLFAVGQGVLEDEQGNSRPYEQVSSEVGEYFNAHGIAKGPFGQQFESLISLLDKGIDKKRNFYTAPFRAPEGVGGATADGSAYKQGIAVLSSGFRGDLSNEGIKHVFINDIFGAVVKPLQDAYPQYKFHLLSDQKEVLETEAKEAQETGK